MPSATVKGPWVDPVITDILLPMMPVLPTLRSNRSGNCILDSSTVVKGNEYNGFVGMYCDDAERSPSRLPESQLFALSVYWELTSLNDYPVSAMLEVFFQTLKLNTCT